MGSGMSTHHRPSPQGWFDDHYHGAVDQIIDFLAADGITLEGQRVADVGCGEGTVALGLAHRSGAAHIDAYDVRTPDRDHLASIAASAGMTAGVPTTLALHESSPDAIPAPSDWFDVVVSWSVFEHVSDPVAMLSEVRRILKPDGVFFLQIWPLFHSEHGGHLWLTSADEPYAHLRSPAADIAARISGDEGTYPGFAAHEEWASLNRLSLDDLQRALLAARLIPSKVELLTTPVHLTRDLMRHRLSDLTIGGVKLLAVPWGVTPEATDEAAGSTP